MEPDAALARAWYESKHEYYKALKEAIAKTPFLNIPPRLDGKEHEYTIVMYIPERANATEEQGTSRPIDAAE
jgi:hypothetical protein